MRFTLGIHLGQPYSPSLIDPIVVGLIQLSVPGTTIASFSMKPWQGVTPDELVNGTFSRGGLRRVFIDRSEAMSELSHGLLVELEGVLARKELPYTMHTRIDDEGFCTVEISVDLGEAKSDEFLVGIVGKTMGEAGLHELLGRARFVWAMPGIDEYVPTIHDVLAGREPTPTDCAAFGAELVEILGRSALARLLDSCPKVLWLSNGSVFFCWSWRDTEAMKSGAYGAFESNVRASFGRALMEWMRRQGHEVS